MGRVRIERVTIRDIPLERWPSTPMPKEAPAKTISERSWTLLRVASVAIIVVGLGYASMSLSPGLAGAVVAATGAINTGFVAGVVGVALVATIALSAVVSHED